MHNLKNRKSGNQKGFTIIEVMIVLAIAGLIMLIVFLAVPALQRNARNTQRRQDVGRVGAAVQEVLNNNNGQMASVTAANVQAAVGTNLAYYTVTNVTVAAGPAAVTNGTTVDTVVAYTGAVCAAMTGGRGATSAGATTRQVAIVYSTEAGSGAAKICTDS
jgi:prepilin-type N-terminal cleavage/methylation domain-containing protein